MGFEKRPDHDDFWLMSEVLQDLDRAAEDVGIERTAGTVDMDSLGYVAVQRAIRIMATNEQVPTERALAQIAACWIDAFVTGLNFQKRRNNSQSGTTNQE